MSLYAGVAWGMLNCSLHTQEGPASVQRISQEEWFLHTRNFGPFTQPLLLGQSNAVGACERKQAPRAALLPYLARLFSREQRTAIAPEVRVHNELLVLGGPKLGVPHDQQELMVQVVEAGTPRAAAQCGADCQAIPHGCQLGRKHNRIGASLLAHDGAQECAHVPQQLQHMCNLVSISELPERQKQQGGFQN